jgi:hypothetical protein
MGRLACVVFTPPSLYCGGGDYAGTLERSRHVSGMTANFHVARATQTSSLNASSISRPARRKTPIRLQHRQTPGRIPPPSNWGDWVERRAVVLPLLRENLPCLDRVLFSWFDPRGEVAGAICDTLCVWNQLTYQLCIFSAERLPLGNRRWHDALRRALRPYSSAKITDVESVFW